MSESVEVTTAVPGAHRSATPELHAAYTTLEILVAIVAIVGNAMVIHVFRRDRRLRRRTNYYIVSLAVADLLVGLLGIPFAILASVGLPRNLHACLFTVSLLVMLCTISIFCLVAVSVDRYWAILHPMCYSRNVRTKTAIVYLESEKTLTSCPRYEWPCGDTQTSPARAPAPDPRHVTAPRGGRARPIPRTSDPELWPALSKLGISPVSTVWEMLATRPAETPVAPGGPLSTAATELPAAPRPTRLDSCETPR